MLGQFPRFFFSSLSGNQNSLTGNKLDHRQTTFSMFLGYDTNMARLWE